MVALDEFVRPAFAVSLAAGRARLSSLRHVRALGAGSIGRVGLYLDDATGERFAIKAVQLDGPAQSVEKRAAVEVAVCRTLDSAGVPTYLAALVEGKTLSLVMEYIEGCSLASLIRTGTQTGPKGLPESAVRCIVTQLVHALQRLHANGIVYVDLKAENVLLSLPGQQPLPQPSAPHTCVDQESASHTLAHQRLTQSVAADLQQRQPQVRVTLLDFDLCHLESKFEPTGAADLKRPEARLEAPQSVIWGTLEYLAPEVVQAGGGGYSHLSDWWSLGVLAFECCYGYTPFMAASQERIFHNITMKAPVFPAEPKVSQHCQYFIRSLLRHKREFRLGAKGGASELLQHPFCLEV